MFKIYHQQARYCSIYGGMLGGTKDVALPMTYLTKALADKLARRMADEEYNCGGDDYYTVVPVGFTPTQWQNERARQHRAERAAAGEPLFDYDMPF